MDTILPQKVVEKNPLHLLFTILMKLGTYSPLPRKVWVQIKIMFRRLKHIFEQHQLNV